MTMSNNRPTKSRARKSGRTSSSGTRRKVHKNGGYSPSSNNMPISSSVRLVKCLPQIKRTTYQRNIGSPPPASREDYMLMARDWVEGVSASINYAIPSARPNDCCLHSEFVPRPLPQLRRYKTQSTLGKRPRRIACVDNSADEGDVESGNEVRKKVMQYYESDSDASLPTVGSEQDFDDPTTPRDASPVAQARVHIATISPTSDRWQVSWERARSSSGNERALSPIPAAGSVDGSDPTVPSWVTLEQQLEEVDGGTKA